MMTSHHNTHDSGLRSARMSWQW